MTGRRPPSSMRLPLRSPNTAAVPAGRRRGHAGVSRATLDAIIPIAERYYTCSLLMPSPRPLPALATPAASAPGRRGIERIVRALTAVADRSAVVARKQVEADPEDIERLVSAPMRGGCDRGIDSGNLRQDLPAEVLLDSSVVPSWPRSTSPSEDNSAWRGKRSCRLCVPRRCQSAMTLRHRSTSIRWAICSRTTQTDHATLGSGISVTDRPSPTFGNPN